MNLSANDLENLPHLEFRNNHGLQGKTIVGVSTDSRKVRSGELFVALKGENFDGHAFVAGVFNKGAAAAIVDASFDADSVPGKPLLVVENTTRTLGDLAHMHRMKFKIPIIAIGGSNGKTTTKDMVAWVLATKYDVLKTEGNLNNHFGVPRTLLRLGKNHEVAIVEIGTNHPGEIYYLCKVLSPTHGLITNMGREHLEFFKSVEGVANEEGVLFDHLRKQKGSVVFVNSDDVLVRAKAKGMRRRITFGKQAKGVDISGGIVGMDASGCANFEYADGSSKRRVAVQLGVPGEHNAMNALAAVAVGLAFKVPSKNIKSALESFRPTTKRMEILNYDGVLIYNDTYNANPDSTILALKTLASARVSGKKIAVLADMLELGEHTEAEHARVGRAVAELGIDYLLTHGDRARTIHDAAKMGNAFHYEQKNMLAEYLAELVTPGDAVLVKGSRGMRMEDIVTFLGERSRSATAPHL